MENYIEFEVKNNGVVYKGKVSPEDAHLLDEHYWRAHIGSSQKNKVYVFARLPKKKRLLMHRVIAQVPEGKWTDHINGDTLDNRRENLRITGRCENMWNAKRRQESQQPYKGIKRRKPWEAKIQVNGKIYRLGGYETPEEAARAYDRAARKYFGVFARLNFPEEGEQSALTPPTDTT